MCIYQEACDGEDGNARVSLDLSGSNDGHGESDREEGVEEVPGQVGQPETCHCSTTHKLEVLSLTNSNTLYFIGTVYNKLVETYCITHN